MKQVTAIEDWGWWFKPGKTYAVEPYRYKATRGAKVDCCSCAECAAEVRGKDLFDMYVVSEGEHAGSIIPVVACRDANTH